MTAYSPIQHLADTIFINHNPRRTLMVMLAGYFDASGADDTTAITVAGYVSTVSKWKKFETTWKHILEKEGIEFFHMKEFAHSTGQFENWKGNEPRRRALLAILIRAIKLHTLKGFSSSVILKDYNDVNRIYELQENVGFAYSMCAATLIGKIERWKKKKYQGDKIEYVFELGDQHQEEFRAIATNRMRIYPDFKPKSWSCAFEAGDFLAWENRNYLGKRFLDPEYKQIRHTLGQLVIQHPCEWMRFPKKALLEDCAKLGIPRRTVRRIREYKASDDNH